MSGDSKPPRESSSSAAGPSRDRQSSDQKGISEREIEDIEERSSPRTPVIYEIVRRLGEEEMERPATSLWWSGLAAGLSISFSLLAQGILQLHLPDTPWRPLITSLGYPVGFIMVVLSRQQLFTETTITVVLPVMARFTASKLLIMLRMWVIVLVANLAGTLFAAAFCTFTPVLTPDLKQAMLQVSGGLMADSWFPTFVKAISAGFLMAAMVWLIPSAAGAQLYVVALMTYLIAAGGFEHIVAGSMEGFMLVTSGHLASIAMFLGFFLPVLAGNIVGGTALFTLLSYAQVMKEID